MEFKTFVFRGAWTFSQVGLCLLGRNSILAGLVVILVGCLQVTISIYLSDGGALFRPTRKCEGVHSYVWTDVRSIQALTNERPNL